MNAATLHGHFCPGLALGVLAGSQAVREMSWESEGLEHVLAIVETNNCFSDGIQYTTGCTFGNNALIYRNYGKTAFTLTRRSGEGIRLIVKNDFYEKLQLNSPDYFKLFDKVIKKRDNSPKLLARFKDLAAETSLTLIKYDITELFNIERVNVDIPKYAPMHNSVKCDKCGENASYRVLNGSGIINKG